MGPAKAGNSLRSAPPAGGLFAKEPPSLLKIPASLPKIPAKAGIHLPASPIVRGAPAGDGPLPAQGSSGGGLSKWWGRKDAAASPEGGYRYAPSLFLTPRLEWGSFDARINI